MPSYIIIHDKKGIFNEVIKYDGSSQMFDAFAIDHYNKYEFGNARVFKNPADASEYITNTFNKDFASHLTIHPLDRDYNEYVDYIDIVRSGYADYAGYMINTMETPTKTMQ